MTKAQQALIEIANDPDDFVASTALECIFKHAPKVCDSDPEKITKATNGLLNGKMWCFAMGKAYGIALKYTTYEQER